MKAILKPKVLVPVLLSVGILAALLAFGNINTVVRLMIGFPRIDLLWFLLLMSAYEAVRCVQWHFLLKALRVHVPLRAQVFAFMVGETGKSMPIGNYFQSFLLARSRGEDFGRLSAASTLIILNEVAVSLIGVVIIGVGSWTGWLRPVIIVGVLAFGLLAFGVSRIHESPRIPQWVRTHKFWLRVLDELRQFRAGAHDILQPKPAAIMFSLGAVYLIIGGVALYLVAIGLGITTVSLWDALAVSFFSLAFALIFPLPIDFGVAEISGTGAFLALGVSRADAVSVELIYRALSIGSAIAIALIGMVFMRDELRRALQQRPKSGRLGASPRRNSTQLNSATGSGPAGSDAGPRAAAESTMLPPGAHHARDEQAERPRTTGDERVDSSDRSIAST